MFNRLVYRVHAIQRMAERGVDENDVRRVLESGEVVQSYPDDRPFPSRLMLGFVEHRPLHVVAADDTENRTTYVITVYEPGLDEWDASFRRRKSS